MKIRYNTLSVTEILGTILLLIIAVSVLSVVYLQILSDQGPTPQTFIRLSGKVEGTNIIVEHQGGEALASSSTISIALPDEEVTVQIHELLDDSNHDGYWNIGERLVKPFEYNMSKLDLYLTANITAIDTESNSIAFYGPVSFNPKSDISVSIKTNDPNPEIEDIITITVTVECLGGDVDGSGAVQVKYSIPEGLDYQGYSTSQGAYNNSSGLWDVGNVYVGSPATLSLNIKVGGIQIRENSHLIMILDGSGSISYGDWELMTEGLSKAVADEDIFPHDASVELSVIQFGVDNNKCRVELPSTVITKSNYLDIAGKIYDMKYAQGKGWTPTAAALYFSANTLKNSGNYSIDNRRILCMVTDGEPTCWSNIEEVFGRDCGTGSSAMEKARTSAENAKDYIISDQKLEFNEEKDELNVMAVGSGPDIDWLNSSIVWPQPGYIAPPFHNGSGWVSKVDTWNEFASRLNEMFRNIFFGIPNIVEVYYSVTIDPNINNDQAVLIIMPDT